MNETEDQTRLRRAKEAITFCQERENEARRALASAVDSTKRARQQFEELFTEAEKRECARRLAAYDHTTK